MFQKIIKVGNSLAVTIPARFAKEAKLKAGKQLYIETDTSHKTIMFRDKQAKYSAGGSDELSRWYSKFSKNNSALLKELARK